MKETIKKLNYILTKKDKQYLLFLLFFSIIVSVVEVIGVGIIMPFISVATDFNNIFNNHYMKFIYHFFHFSSPLEFVVSFGVFLVFFYIFRSLFNLFYFYLLNRFSQSRYSILAYRLFENYLGMHYIDFILSLIHI